MPTRSECLIGDQVAHWRIQTHPRRGSSCTRLHRSRPAPIDSSQAAEVRWRLRALTCIPRVWLPRHTSRRRAQADILAVCADSCLGGDRATAAGQQHWAWPAGAPLDVRNGVALVYQAAGLVEGPTGARVELADADRAVQGSGCRHSASVRTEPDGAAGEAHRKGQMETLLSDRFVPPITAGPRWTRLAIEATRGRCSSAAGCAGTRRPVGTEGRVNTVLPRGHRGMAARSCNNPRGRS